MVLPIIRGAKCSSTTQRVNVCGSIFDNVQLSSTEADAGEVDHGIQNDIALTNEQQKLQQHPICCHHIAVTRNSEATLMASLSITYLPASAWDENSLGDDNDQDAEGKVEYIYYDNNELLKANKMQDEENGKVHRTEDTVKMVGVAHLEITVTDLAGNMSAPTSVSSKSHCTEFRLPIISARLSGPPSLPINCNVLDCTTAAASMTFSLDSSQLACLVPLCNRCCSDSSIDDDNNIDATSHNPLGIASTLVIFGLDHEVSDEDDNLHHKFDRNDLPLPSFLHPHCTQPTDSSAFGSRKIRVLPEPCDPRIIRGILSRFYLPFDLSKRSQRAVDPSSPARDSTFITSLCNCGGSALLAGCDDGSIIIINWKLARIAGLLHHGPLATARGHAVLSLCHTIRDSITPHSYSCDTHADEDGLEGRLSAVREDGSITLYRTSSASSEAEKGDELDLSFDKISEDENILILDSSSMLTADVGNPPSSPMFALQSSAAFCDSSSSILQGFPSPEATKAYSSKRRHAIVIRLDVSLTLGGSFSSHIDNHDSTLSNTAKGTNGFHDRPRRRSSNHNVCYLHAAWIDYYTLAATVDIMSLPAALRKSNREHPVCHVWAFCNDISEATATCRRERTSKKLISVLSLHPNRITEEPHSLFGKRPSDRNNLHAQPRSRRIRPHSTVAFDPFSGCVLVANTMMASHKSMSDLRSFLCIWDWKTCVVGAVISERPPQSTVFSKAISGNFGHTLFHAHASKNILSLDSYPLVFLNPPESRVTCISQTSPLVLSPSYISFPFLSNATLSHQANISPDKTLDWKEAHVPTSYISSHGSVSVCAIGRKYGRSIAVASSRGLCILDLTKVRKTNLDVLSKHCLYPGRSLPCIEDHGALRRGTTQHVKDFYPKWRLFANEQDEKNIKVHAMAWWERDDEDDDLLLAVVQLLNDFERNQRFGSGPLFRLFCWSRRELSREQILVEVRESESGTKMQPNSAGLILPQGVLPHTLSFLPLVGDQGANKSKRATLIISSVGEIANYAVAQLEAKETTGTSSRGGGLNCTYTYIAGSLSGSGTIPAGGSLITSLFLAGVCTSTREAHMMDRLTLGVGTLSEGLEAVSISIDFSSVPGPVLQPDKLESERMKSIAHRIVQYWLSDIIVDNNLRYTNLWTIRLTTGRFVCWKVPCTLASRRHFENALVIGGNSGHEDASSLKIGTPAYMTPRLSADAHVAGVKDPRQRLGSISDAHTLPFGGSLAVIGDSSSIGPLPNSNGEAVLFLCQRSRPLRKHAPTGFASKVDVESGEIFAPSNFTIAPPSYTTTLLLWLLEASKNGDAVMELAREFIHRHAMEDSLDFSLRVIMLHLLNAGMKRGSVVQSEDETAHSSVLRSFLVLLQTSMSSLHFLTFSAILCRQLEPSCLDVLFPLPAAFISAVTTSQCRAKNIEDVSLELISHGSVAGAASGLPLFLSQQIAHEVSILIMCHCLCVLSQDAVTGNQESRRLEERAIVLELYNYCIKVEEALQVAEFKRVLEVDVAFEAHSTESIVASETKQRKAAAENNSHLDAESTRASKSSAKFNSTSYGEATVNTSDLETKAEITTPRIFHGAALNIFRRQKNDEASDLIDKEIEEAATCFILSGLDREISASLQESLVEIENTIYGIHTLSPIREVDQHRDGICSIELISASFLASAFGPHKKKGHIESVPWKSIAYISSLFVPSPYLDLQTIEIESALGKVSFDDACVTHAFEHNETGPFDVKENQTLSPLSQWIVGSLTGCSSQLNLESRAATFCFITKYLQRGDVAQVNTAMLSRLRLITLVAGISMNLDGILNLVPDATHLKTALINAISPGLL